MSQANDDLAMAVFCDFENVALGVRDAQYDKFDIKPILERLLLKGSIVVKKAYCDWERYKGFKAAMHEANFELIEIPHVRQSGKNSADIRLVVDALDLCYTKAHVDTFVIVSGDSDFSPLVSKLRENAKRVIGVGVKQSTSDLLIANCDEFIYYDDLVRDREGQKNGRRDGRDAQGKRSAEDEKKRRDDLEARRSKGIELAVATVEALLADRADNERVWASVVKEALKRRNPGFNESYYGFRAFGNLLEEAASRGLLEFGRDERSGAYVSRRQPGVPALDSPEPALAEALPIAAPPVPGEPETAATAVAVTTAEIAAEAPTRKRRGGRGARGGKARTGAAEAAPSAPPAVPAPAEPTVVATVAAALEKPAKAAKPARAAKVPKTAKTSPEAKTPTAAKPAKPRARRKPKTEGEPPGGA